MHHTVFSLTGGPPVSCLMTKSLIIGDIQMKGQHEGCKQGLMYIIFHILFLLTHVLPCSHKRGPINGKGINSAVSCKSQKTELIVIPLEFLSFFFFFLVFLGQHPGHMEVPRLGVHLELHLQASAGATAHGSARSLTHWARSGIKPTTSWFLVTFVSTAPQWELHPVGIWSEIFCVGWGREGERENGICKV